LTIRLDIPHREVVELQHAVFDINGTLAVDGVAASGVADRLHRLAEHLSIHLLTAATHGNVTQLERDLGFPLRIIIRGEEKMRYVQQLGPAGVIAFGNGANDVGMLRLAAIGIVVVTAEGIAARAVQTADVIARSPADALDLLLKPQRLIATLRG